MKIIVSKLSRAFDLTQDLIEFLDEEHLVLDLPALPSNTIGEQVWCMVGARESYLKAIQAGEWIDFTCSLTDVKSKKVVLDAMEQSARDVLDYLDEDELDVHQVDFLLELLEHEIMHHGQLIRYIYGNKLGFPQSWSDRYTV